MDSNYRKVARLISLRNMIDTILDNAITDYVMLNKSLDTEQLKESLDYVIEDNIDAYNQGR